MKIETRNGAPELERRAFAVDKMIVQRADEKAEPHLVGHAAVFNQEVDIGGWFFERIAPGAFARAIKEDDVRALFNHDANWVLGRNKAKTLIMREDATGLAVDIVPPDTQLVRDMVLAPIERGDVSQMSFGFRVVKEQWEERGKDLVRTLVEVELWDVSPVTFPAYPTTDIGLRSMQAFKDSRQQGLVTTTPGLIRRQRVQRLREHS